MLRTDNNKTEVELASLTENSIKAFQKIDERIQTNRRESKAKLSALTTTNDATQVSILAHDRSFIALEGELEKRPTINNVKNLISASRTVSDSVERSQKAFAKASKAETTVLRTDVKVTKIENQVTQIDNLLNQNLTELQKGLTTAYKSSVAEIETRSKITEETFQAHQALMEQVCKQVKQLEKRVDQLEDDLAAELQDKAAGPKFMPKTPVKKAPAANKRGALDEQANVPKKSRQDALFKGAKAASTTELQINEETAVYQPFSVGNDSTTAEVTTALHLGKKSKLAEVIAKKTLVRRDTTVMQESDLLLSLPAIESKHIEKIANFKGSIQASTLKALIKAVANTNYKWSAVKEKYLDLQTSGRSVGIHVPQGALTDEEWELFFEQAEKAVNKGRQLKVAVCFHLKKMTAGNARIFRIGSSHSKEQNSVCLTCKCKEGTPTFRILIMPKSRAEELATLRENEVEDQEETDSSAETSEDEANAEHEVEEDAEAQHQDQKAVHEQIQRTASTCSIIDDEDDGQKDEQQLLTDWHSMFNAKAAHKAK